MRTDPSAKYERETKEQIQERINVITRKVAIIFCLVVIVFFYLKMLIP